MKQGNTLRHSIRRNRGFSLLEAMIGFFILSIGMLGIASLQGVSLKAGKTSVYSSVAMMKVDELFESMRANPSAAALAAYDLAGDGGGVEHNCTGTSIMCSPVFLAEDDVFLWKKNLKAGLPDAATTTVSVTAPVPPSKLARVIITVSWQERSKTALSGTSKTYSTTAFICTAIPC